jgi:predicted nuclease with TOPRIM domain
MDGDLLTKIGGGIAALGAAAYGVLRMVKKDRREDSVTALHDEAIQHVIETLRSEVARLSERLAAVEEQNQRCEERNDQMHQELLELKAKLHVT